MVATKTTPHCCYQHDQDTALLSMRFGLEGPVKVIYPSVDLVYRSAFPLVRVEVYPN